MKKSVKAYLLKRFNDVNWDEDGTEVPVDPLAQWPNIKLCVESYYNSHPEMKQYHQTARKPVEFRYTEKFMKSLDRYCTTIALKTKLIDALTKKVYGIPCSGLRDAPIKEKLGLWHFYITVSWRVFYRKEDDYLLFEEFSPHKKTKYCRRP